MISATVSMPLVLEDDAGIRQIKPGECFYCSQKVGQEHLEECVCVLQRVRYEVRVGGKSWEDFGGEIVGSFERDDPYHWAERDCEFHKNGSSWCASNALDAIHWLGTPKAKELHAKIQEMDTSECCCSLLAFAFSEIVIEGPYRSERD